MLEMTPYSKPPWGVIYYAIRVVHGAAKASAWTFKS